MHPFRLIHHESASRRPCVSPARVEAMLPDDEGFGDWHIRTFRNGSVHVFGWYQPESRELSPFAVAVPFTVKLRQHNGCINLDVRATREAEDFLFSVFLSAFAPILRHPGASDISLDSRS